MPVKIKSLISSRLEICKRLSSSKVSQICHCGISWSGQDAWPSSIASWYWYWCTYEWGTYFCRFSEDVPLATSSPRQYICMNMSVGAIMLPLNKNNQQFLLQYSVIYSDWDILRSNRSKASDFIWFVVNLTLYLFDNFSPDLKNCCMVFDACCAPPWGEYNLLRKNATDSVDYQNN